LFSSSLLINVVSSLLIGVVEGNIIIESVDGPLANHQTIPKFRWYEEKKSENILISYIERPPSGVRLLILFPKKLLDRLN
jgi:hypothetical protein